MKRRILITAAALAAMAPGAIMSTAAARECRAACIEWAQQRLDNHTDGGRLRAPYRRLNGNTYGGPSGEGMRALPPGPNARTPLPDGQIWAIAKRRVPGRIVNARLQGRVYSFRIISTRGSIVDVVVDRYSGRIVSVRGGP